MPRTWWLKPAGRESPIAVAGADAIRRGMQTVSIALGERSYPIHIGDRAAGPRDLIAQVLARKSVPS